MDNWPKHICKTGKNTIYKDEDPPQKVEELRQQIEPWLSAVFQSEHLSLLLGNGLTIAIAKVAGADSTSMETIDINGAYNDKIKNYAKTIAADNYRTKPNIEDQIRAIIMLINGLRVLGDNEKEKTYRKELDGTLRNFVNNILKTEKELKHKIEEENEDEGIKANDLLCSFVLSFASRTPTRDRLNIFTTNYDRLIEYACDWTGIRTIDRFVGTLSPIFRASRMDIDVHYNPPGIRGEPRYLEGVVKLTKLHGSIDWCYKDKIFRKIPIPFGADQAHPDIMQKPSEKVIIYPNPAKELETCEYPYAELFRDFSSAICRPNSAIVTYGYGFGDEHINRIIIDMLTLPSTHLVIISYDNADNRIKNFIEKSGHATQISLLLGCHFGDIEKLVENYLPKPAIDRISIRQTRLKANRGDHIVPGIQEPN